MAIQPEIVNQLVEGIKTSDELFGPNGLVNQLSKQLMDRMLQAEMRHHLGYEKHAKTIPRNVHEISWTFTSPAVRLYN